MPRRKLDHGESSSNRERRLRRHLPLHELPERDHRAVGPVVAALPRMWRAERLGSREWRRQRARPVSEQLTRPPGRALDAPRRMTGGLGPTPQKASPEAARALACAQKEARRQEG